MKGGVKVSEFGEDLDRQIEEIMKANPPRNRLWSEKEIYVLRKMWGRTAAKSIMNLLPGRTKEAIKKKAESLDLGR